MYAIIATGGKQYKVAPGDFLDVERLDGAAKDLIQLDQVLAVHSDTQFQIGRPLVKGVSVSAQIVDQLKGPKVINFKYKRRKGYHRKVGHRQQLTRIKIQEISL